MGDTLRNSLPSTIAAYPHSHCHLLVATTNDSPTSAINRDSVDQYCGVLVRMDDVEHVEFIASRVALGYSTGKSRCRGALHATVMNDKQRRTRPNRTHKGGRIRVFESVPCRPFPRDKGRVGLSALIPLRCRRVAVGWLLAKRCSCGKEESCCSERSTPHSCLRWWSLAFSPATSIYTPSPR